MPIVGTPSIDALLANPEANAFIGACLSRFHARDWGDIHEDDAKMNDAALKTGARILASYPTPDHPIYAESRLWVIADAVAEDADGDPARVITILYPSEY